MTRELEVGVRLTADGKELVGAVRTAQSEIERVSQTAKKANDESAAAAERFTASLKRQADTVGMTAGQVLKYDAAQLQLNATQRASVDASLRTIQAYEQQQAAARKNVDVLSSLKTQIIATGAAYLSFNAAIAGGHAVIDAALANERLNSSLKVGLGSQQAATQELKFLREEADRLGLQFASAAEQYAKLTAASKGTELQGQKTRDIFLAVAKASTVLGLSTDQTGGALLAIEQMISKGTVSAEELRGQLGERLPGAFQLAARAIGVTTQELGTMLQKGEITAEQLLPALAAELEKTYGAQAQASAEGLNAQINRLDNSFTDLKLAVGQAGIINLFSDGVVAATEFIGVTTQVIQQLKAIGAEIRSMPGADSVASSASNAITPGNIIRLVTGNAVLGNMVSSGILGQVFSKDARAEVAATTQELQKAEEVISRIIRPGAKPEPPKEFMAALKAEADERKKLTDTAIREAQRAAQAREREEKQAVDSAQRIIDALKRETEEIGKNAIQKRMLAAAAEAAKAPTKELAAEIMASAQAWAEATQQQEAALALQREQQQAAQARAQAETAAARQVQQEWNQMWSAVENTARTSFIQFAAHGKDAMESIGDAIQNSIIDLLYQLTVRKWIINIGASMSGSLFGSSGSLASSGTGSSGMGALDFANIGSSALNFASTGFGTTTMIGNSLMGLGGGVGSTLGSFGAGIVGGSEAAAFLAAESATAGAGAAAGFGASFASVAGPLAAAAITTQIFRAFAGDKRMGGGFGDALNTVGDIPILGDFIPVVPLMNSLFGRGPLEQKETNLIGDITATGFEGITSTKFKAQGGLARSDKVDRVMTDTDSGELLNQYGELVEGGISKTLEPFAEQASAYATQLGKFLDDSISGISKSARTMADTLGVGSDALDNFSFGVNIASKKGQALTDEQIGQVIADASDAMVRTLIPAIDSLSKNGESAYQTLQRISTEFNVLTGLGAALGNSLADTEAFLRDVSFEERSAFVAAAGGADALAIKTQFFADNYLSEGERLKPSIELLDREMSKLGLSAEISKRQFRDLVQSFGQVDGISEEMMQGLLNVAPLFAQVKDGLASLYPELQTTADATYDLASAESLLADKRSALVAAYSREKTELEGVITRFSDLAANLRDASDALSLGGLSPLTPEQRLDEARNQFNQDRLAANAGDEAALQRLPQSAQAFLEASQVYNASSAEYVSDFNFVQQVLESAAVTAQSQASIAELTLAELETSVGKLGVIDDHIVDLSTAMAEYTAAVLQGFGNLLVSNQDIRDFLSTHSVQESIDWAVQNGVSGSQAAGALGVSQSVINQATGGLTVADQQIRDFVSLNSDPMAIYNAAIANGISSTRLSEVTGISLNDINQFVRDNNLASFAVGTDLVPRDGLAMLHAGEAVTPSSTVAEIKTIKRLLEVSEGTTNTSSIVNRLAENNESVANVRSITNQLAETNNNVANITSIVDRLAKVNDDKSIINRLVETNDSSANITSIFSRLAKSSDTESIINRLTEFNERSVNNLASFAVGTDYVPRDGFAMLHKGEAVTPSSTVSDIKTIRRELDERRINPIIYTPPPDIVQRGGTAINQNHVVAETVSTLVEEVKALKNELTELRREQNQQTGALINVAIQSQKMNADMIIKSNQESDKSAAWREQAKAVVR